VKFFDDDSFGHAASSDECAGATSPADADEVAYRQFDDTDEQLGGDRFTMHDVPLTPPAVAQVVDLARRQVKRGCRLLVGVSPSEEAQETPITVAQSAQEGGEIDPKRSLIRYWPHAAIEKLVLQLVELSFITQFTPNRRKRTSVAHDDLR
jgi:hypothetical protein